MDAFCFQKLWDIVFDRFFSDAQFENGKKSGFGIFNPSNPGFFLEAHFLEILSLLRIHKQKTGCKWQCFASRSSETSDSIDLFPVLNLKMEKKSFRKFQPIESGAQLKKSKKSRKKTFLPRNKPGFCGLKIP